ncbi:MULTISPECIES: MBL fold metallo-hydrolase [unclassified Imperialibacter]|uniref:MBL fold metallo-hydrolase n=1 Tax=unclassified Imperialibacter TaxID=2629706 RepID=UPI00125201F0|nr:MULTISPECIES: MBL fold metallo-hydrolase [unclassified Imperialibacter]CAD5299310.1 MBL fold metallo-hydrolase [Imperialibacter sp. 89]CAD5299897.1 MBL fold metallo-hydrolase [Imperialibacter sp. 75]VVT15711.1 MBL fold metallo-hydrolase [Imperialibacter sp. EC-SDR9]
MKLTFLGTGTSQGVPVIACNCEVCQSVDFHDKRLRSSVHIEVDGLSLVIDTGPDFRQQMLRERIKRLDAVIFTHEHKDHTAGLDDIRSFNFLQQMDMPVYASTAVITQLKREFSYIFADHKYPGVPLVDVKLLDGNPFIIGQTTITPINVMHFKLPVFGFRIGDFTYITDANYISDEEKEKIKGSKVLVLNALQKAPHISHFTLDEAVALAQELKADQTYFTHISHKLGTHTDVSAQLPENIYLAYDGQQLTL